MLKRHEVEILLKAGHSKTEVARIGRSLVVLGEAHRARESSRACG